MSVPFPRTLPYVLREQLAKGDAVSVIVGKVVSVPNNAHVRVEVQGGQFTVPKLASYTAPVANEPVYLLVSPAVTIALGTVKT